MSEFKVIRLTKKTYEDLTKLGNKGDTYDDILIRLLDKQEKKLK